MANTVPSWFSQAIFYEIYPQSFYDTNGDGIGDLQGIIEKLDYVKYLGCNAIWINPCFVSPFGDAGYDVADYYTIAPRYGTNDDAKELIAQAHRRGIKVCFDFVPGHTSTEHKWFKESCKSRQNQYSNRYIWTDSVWTQPKDQAFVAGYSERDACYITNFFHMQPALNYGYAEPDPSQPWQFPTDHPDVIALREEMKNVMRFWLDMGMDGFRVDVAGSLVKNDANHKKTAEIWQDVRFMFDREYPDAALIAEWSNPSEAIHAGFHADFMLHFPPPYYTLFRREVTHLPVPETRNMNSYFNRKGKGDIRQFLDAYLQFYNDTIGKGYVSLISGNHDLSRVAMDRAPDDLKVVFAFILTMPGVPFIYYGDEIGIDYMKGLVSKEGGFCRTGSRIPMRWKKGANAGFSTASQDELYLPVNEDGPDVESQMGVSDSLLETVRTLINLRLSYPALASDGEFEPVYAEQDAYPFVYCRRLGDEMVLVALNPAERPVELDIEAVSGRTDPKPLMEFGASMQRLAAGIRLEMEGVSFGVYILK